MEKVSERAFDVVLVLVAVVLAGLGATGVVVAAVAIGGLVVVLGVLALVRLVRSRRPRAIPASGPPTSAIAAATHERDRLLRQGSEAPEKRSEREGLTRDARQIASGYRAMAVLSGIRATEPETRAAWLDAVIQLHRRLGDYADRWQVVLPDASHFSPLVPPVEPDWLEGMARDADTIAWQLDHEDGGPVRTHQLAAVGGVRSTCTCGLTFDTGPAFNAHVASAR